MSAVRVHIEGVGLYGPGLQGWDDAAPRLRGEQPFELAALALPAPEALPPAERRRVGLALKLALATGFDAVRHAQRDPASLPTVFSSTGSDCDNCHQILTTLASDDRAVSPTRFHNSVHNMPAGYWSIATGCMAASTSLCAFDATFAAGLIEAATQARCARRATLLVAFDTSYPEPLYALRPIAHALGVGLVITPERTERTLATLDLRWSRAPATPLDDAALEALRVGVPAVRSLPLLQALARREARQLVIDHLGDLQLAVAVQP
ncbi:beta-ketoacyl synthase chain length factor [Aquabacterium sp.]|uniref:beta-ketoacyl synthase chain length factor n=1 Tax=Aquabacterium sp. TaxID=1872578 RepID=UPI0035AF4ED7